MIDDLIYKSTKVHRKIVLVNKRNLWKGKSEKTLSKRISSSGGRNNKGRMTVRKIGGGHRKIYRQIDFKRNHLDEFKVERIEYDPNRTGFIALVRNQNNKPFYFLAPENLAIGSTIENIDSLSTKIGNCTTLYHVPIGTKVFNLEMSPGAGAILARSAGTFCTVQGKESGFAIIQVPSGKLMKIKLECRCTIGTMSNAQHYKICLGKAGAMRNLGYRPGSRGVAKNSNSHPNGGRTKGGKVFRNVTGKVIKGKKTANHKRARRKEISTHVR